MTMGIASDSLKRTFFEVLHDRRGVSAIEFAMILPLMLAIYVGTAEMTQAVSIDRKVTLTTRTVADLTSQVASIDNTAMTDILKATAAVIAPYDKSKLKVVVSAVRIDTNGVAKITWSETLNGSKRTVNSTVTIPTALKVKETTLIWSEVSYSYEPTIGGALTGTINLSDQIFMRPRLSDTICRNTTC
jgi:Flp pilus assembly protein TadG